MKYIIDSKMHEYCENFDKDEMIIHFENNQNITLKKEQNKKQNYIDNMINNFNKQLDWDNKRIQAYFDAVDYIINGCITTAKEKIELAAEKGFFETNLIEFGRNTIISPNNQHDIKLLGLIYHTRYNPFYSDNKLPYLIDYIRDLLKPYNIIF